MSQGKERKWLRTTKEANYATWGDSDAEMLSSDEEDQGFKNGVCFMASSNQVSSPIPSVDSDSDDGRINVTPFESLDEAYELLVSKWNVINEENKMHKKFKRYLKKKLLDLSMSLGK